MAKKKKQGSLRTYTPKGAKGATGSMRGRKRNIDAVLARATGRKKVVKKKASRKK